MDPLESSQVRQFSAALEELYRPATREEFPSRIFAVVSAMLPETALTFDEVCNATGQVRNAASFTPPAGWVEALEQTLERDHPAVKYLRDGGSETVLPIWDLTTQRQLRETQFWREVLVPMRVRDQVAVTVPTSGRIVGLTVNRDSLFRSKEVTVLRLLAPHLKQAYEVAETLSRLRGQADRFPSFDPIEAQRYKLSARELEVLQWLTDGKRDKEIGVILGISSRTVEKHVSRILEKLGVETRAAAVRKASVLQR